MGNILAGIVANVEVLDEAEDVTTCLLAVGYHAVDDQPEKRDGAVAFRREIVVFHDDFGINGSVHGRF